MVIIVTTGMAAFLDCLQQFKEEVEKGDSGFHLPYGMEKGKIKDPSTGSRHRYFIFQNKFFFSWPFKSDQCWYIWNIWYWPIKFHSIHCREHIFCKDSVQQWGAVDQSYEVHADKLEMWPGMGHIKIYTTRKLIFQTSSLCYDLWYCDITCSNDFLN